MTASIVQARQQREAITRAMAPQIARLLQRWAAEQVELGLTNLGMVEKVRSPFAGELKAILVRYGAVMIDDEGKRISGRSFGRGRLIEDALRGRTIPLGQIDEWSRKLDDRVKLTLEESRTEVRRLISQALVDAEMDSGRQLTLAEQARAVRDRVTDHASFSQPRALRIARTETGIAQAAGQEQAIRDVGFESTRWLAYPTKLGDKRNHGAMNGKVVAVGDYFTTPLGNRCLYPHDPSLPPEDVVNCRCGRQPVVKARPKR